MNTITIYSFIPEFFLTMCALTHLIFNIFFITSTSQNFRVVTLENLLQTLFILSLTGLLVFNTEIEGFFYNFLFVANAGNNIVKLSSILISLLLLIPVYINFKNQKLSFYEYFTLYLLVNLSLLLLISATDMLAVYLAIELQALSFYIMASFLRQSAFSSEAGLKYFILGSAFSGFFLFGCSIIYGIFGTLNFNYLAIILLDNLFLTGLNDLQLLVAFAFLLISSTFLFKLAVAPFHFWAPDVYDGIPLSSTIIFSVLPKLGTVYFLIKWISIVAVFFKPISLVLMYCGIISLFIGSIFALLQTRLKKLIIYSSIAQIGYVIISFFQLSLNSIISIYFFLFIYLITLILIWNTITLLFFSSEKLLRFTQKVTNQGLFISFLQSLSTQHFIWALFISCIFFSIAGIPPFSGFLAKFLILQVLIEAKAIICASTVVLISLLTLFYYLRLIKIVFFEPILLKTKNNSALTILNSQSLITSTHLSAFLMFFLLFFFIEPNFLLIVCNLIALSI